jgi:hypothetical protein
MRLLCKRLSRKGDPDAIGEVKAAQRGLDEIKVKFKRSYGEV